MKGKDIAIVFDCGATNVRVVAIDKSGKILAMHAIPNETHEDPNFTGGRIWDMGKLWGKLCKAAKIVSDNINVDHIVGITVTTFGVDGTFIDEKGELLYPVISWQCERTSTVMNEIDKYIPLKILYKISGVYPYAFNTINKIIWFKENHPDIIENANRFLFIPSLLVNKLSGVSKNDTTMMGTSMMADLQSRQLSEKILNAVGLDKELFGPIGDPGEYAGEINTEASKLTGIPKGTPLFLTGHDTQLAMIGSGAQLNQPVLSSGTWEVLMSRSQSFTTSRAELEQNLTTELDPIPGIYNIGQNWLGSGILEWFSKSFYQGLSGDKLYASMINEAEMETPGSKGINIDPVFYNDGNNVNAGTIAGLTIATRRGQLYRAFLESFAYRLREGLEALESAGNFKAENIICVGGGSKNKLWNQLRADVCGIPVRLIEQKETTVLGASMFVFVGAGVYSSIDEACQNINYDPKLVIPSSNRQVYEKLYCKYLDFRNHNQKL